MSRRNPNEEESEVFKKIVWFIRKAISTVLGKAPGVILKYAEGREFHLPLRLEREYHKSSYSIFQSYCKSILFHCEKNNTFYIVTSQILFALMVVNFFVDIMLFSEFFPTPIPTSYNTRLVFIIVPFVDVCVICAMIPFFYVHKAMARYLLSIVLIFWINLTFIIRISLVGTSRSSHWNVVFYFLFQSFLYLEWKTFFIIFVVIQTLAYLIFEIVTNVLEGHVGSILIQMSLQIFLVFAALRTAHFLQKQKRMLFLRWYNVCQCHEFLEKHKEKNYVLYNILLPKDISEVVSKQNIQSYLDSKYVNIPFVCVKISEFESIEKFLSAKELISLIHRLFVTFDEEVGKLEFCHRFKTLNHHYMFTIGCPGTLPEEIFKSDDPLSVGSGRSSNTGTGTGSTASIKSSTRSRKSSTARKKKTEEISKNESRNPFYYACHVISELIDRVKKDDFNERNLRIGKIRVSCGLDVSPVCYSCVLGKKQQWDLFAENLAFFLCHKNVVPNTILMSKEVWEKCDNSRLLTVMDERGFSVKCTAYGQLNLVLADGFDKKLKNIGKAMYNEEVRKEEEKKHNRILEIQKERERIRSLSTSLRDLKKIRDKKIHENKSRNSDKNLKKGKSLRTLRAFLKSKKKANEDDRKRRKKIAVEMVTPPSDDEFGQDLNEELLREDEGDRAGSSCADEFSVNEEIEIEEEDEDEGEESDEEGSSSVDLEEEEGEGDLDEKKSMYTVESNPDFKNLDAKTEAGDVSDFDEFVFDEQDDDVDLLEEDDEETKRIDRQIAIREKQIKQTVNEKKLKEREERIKEKVRDDQIEKIIKKIVQNNTFNLYDYVTEPTGKIRVSIKVRGVEVESRLETRYDYQIKEVSKHLGDVHLDINDISFCCPRMKFVNPCCLCFECFPRCPWNCWLFKTYKDLDRNYLLLNQLTFKNMFKKYYKQTRLTFFLWTIGYVISVFIELLKQGFVSEARRDFGWFFGRYTSWDVVFYKLFVFVPPLLASTALIYTKVFIESFFVNSGLTVFGLLAMSSVLLGNFYLFETYETGVCVYITIFFHLCVEGLPAFVRSSILFVVIICWIILAVIQYFQAQAITFSGPKPEPMLLFMHIFIVFLSWFFFTQRVCFRQAQHFKEYFIQGLSLKKLNTLNQVKDKSSDLLASLLSEGYLERMQELSDVSSISKYYEDVAVMVCNLCNCTEYLDKLEHKPDKIVEDLNEIFSQFDTLTDDPRLWRVKSVQGAYIVAAGVPNVSRIASQQIALCAIEIVQWLEYKKKHASFRIGIHSGPIFSGLIFRERFQLDIFGKTIDIAHEFEQKGKRMMIHVSFTFTRAYCHQTNHRKYGFARRSGFVEIMDRQIETYWLLGKEDMKKQKRENKDRDK